MIIINIRETGHGNTLFYDRYLTGIGFRASIDWVRRGIDKIEEALNKGKKQRYGDLLRIWELEQGDTKIPYLADSLYWDPSKMPRDHSGRVHIKYSYENIITDWYEPCINITMLSEPITGVCEREDRSFMIGNDIIKFGQQLEKYGLEYCEVSYIEHDEDSGSFSYVQMYLDQYTPEVMVSFNWDQDILCFRPVAIRSFPDVYSEVHYSDFDPELKRALKLKYPKLIADLYSE